MIKLTLGTAAWNRNSVTGDVLKFCADMFIANTAGLSIDRSISNVILRPDLSKTTMFCISETEMFYILECNK